MKEELNIDIFTFMSSDCFHDTQTSGCAVVSLLAAGAAASAAAALPSDFSKPDVWAATVLLKRRMLICSSSLSTTGVVGYCLVRPLKRSSIFLIKHHNQSNHSNCSIQSWHLPCHFLAVVDELQSLCEHKGLCSRAQGCLIGLSSPCACSGPLGLAQITCVHLPG